MSKLTPHRLLSLADQCVNPQDALILQLIMEGMEIHEIVYLKHDSLDLAAKALLIKNEKETIRKQPISPKCANLFYKAIHQTKYSLFNGTRPSAYGQSTVHLKESDYAIKPSTYDFVANESMIQEMDSVILRTIYNRLKMLADVFSIPELTYLATVRYEYEKQEVYA